MNSYTSSAVVMASAYDPSTLPKSYSYAILIGVFVVIAAMVIINKTRKKDE